MSFAVLKNRAFLRAQKGITFLVILTMVYGNVGELFSGTNLQNFFWHVETALATAGDFSVFRNNADTTTIPAGGTEVEAIWDTVVSENANLALQTGSTTIDLAEGGKYLVLYNVWADASSGGTNRRSFQTYLTLNESPLMYGRGDGYIRDSNGDDEYAYANGAAIINATAGDDLEINIARDDTNTTENTTVRAGTNGVSVLKLKDDFDYLRIYKDTRVEDISGSTTFSDVRWDQSDEVDSTSFDFTPGDTDITLKGDAGDFFLVTLNVRLNQDVGSGNRTNYDMRLTLDGAEIPGTRTNTYLRGDANSNGILSGTLTYTGLVQKSSGSDETLNVQVRRETDFATGNPAVDIVPNETALAIAALPSSANYISLTSASGQSVPNTRSALTFDRQLSISTSTFSHSTTTNASRINIDQDGDYLFFSNAYATRTPGSSGDRDPIRVDWTLDGSTLVQYGGHGSFNRGDQSDYDANTSGSTGGLILPGLTDSQYIEVAAFDEEDNAVTTFEVGQIAVQGVELSLLFQTAVEVAATGTQATDAVIPSIEQELGGTFVITENNSSRNITSITLTESGTVDGLNGLDNIALYYDLDTTNPYDCASESFSSTSTESQFGTTDTTGFSGADGVSSFTGSVGISTTQAFCGYVVYDVTSSAADGDTVNISIDNPENDVTVTGGGSVGPGVTQDIAGVTTLGNLDLTQIHYHWRTDDGTETSVTSGSEDTPAGGFQAGTNRRLRVEVSAEGFDSAATSSGILDDFTTGNTKTISAGTNRLLVVGIHSEDSGSNVDINGVTYGGQTLTQIHDEQVTTVASNGMWVGYLDESGIAAASGNTIVPTWNGGTPDTAVLYSSVVFDHVDQSDPIQGFSGGSSTGVATVQPTTTVSVAAGDQAVYFTVSGSNAITHTADTGYTEGTEEDASGAVAANASQLITSGGTEQPTATWSGASTRLAIVAFNVQFDNSDSDTAQFRLQYGEKTSTCDAISTWTDVAETGGEWEVLSSSNVTDGADTTDISLGTGGMTNEEATFLSPNAAQVNGGDKSQNITISANEFVELEYTLQPTSTATDGSTYCFRVVDEMPNKTHSYRLPLTIQSSQVASTLTDFPVYVDLSTLGSHFFSNVRSDGGDIRITTADGDTEVAREIVSISTGGGTGEMYFLAPSISSTENTTFYIYYGASAELEYQASSTYGTHGVWENGYSAVYHLSESGTTYFDSTSNGNDGVGEATDPSLTTGKIGGGQDFAANGRIDLGTGPSVDLNAAGEYSVSVWLNLDSSGTDQSPVSQYDAAGDFLLWADAADGGTGFCHYNGTYMPSDCRDLNNQNIGSWQYIVAYHNGSSGGIYLDGAETGAGATASTFGVDTAQRFAIGAQNGDSTLRQFDGQIDEVRIASVNFGIDWSAAEYSNQNTPSTFYATSTFENLNDSALPITYDVYPEANITSDAQVSATGTQAATVNEGTTNNYLGGAFVVQDNTGSRDIDSITITELGTVDAFSSLENIELYYEFDTSAADGYDCSSETYAGTELQYGSTGSFSGANGTSTFTDTGIGITTSSSLCLYVIYDVNTNANNGETIDIEISIPNTDVEVSTGSVGPGTAAEITGSTTIQTSILTQTHYHWRNDDGDETDTGATSATGGVEDTALLDVPRESIRRLRLQVSNEGAVTSPATQYRLEYGTKIATCDLVGVWQQVGVGSAFSMATSTFIADGNTTDIDNAANGAMTEENTTFVGTGALREDSSETGSITLASTEYTELEFSFIATDQSGYDTDYCFRVTSLGTEIDTYSTYAELTTREKQDFFVQRDTEVISGTSTTLVAGVDYAAPSATSAAFVRITSSQMTGAGASVEGTQSADDVTAYIEDQSDITQEFTIARPTSATSDTRVDWEIVEYTGLVGADNEMIVRSVGAITYGASGLVATGSAVNNVNDDSDIVVFITGQVHPDTGTSNYLGNLSTAEWASSTAQPVFTRETSSGGASGVSYAVVEFTGLNWNVQRVEHNYLSGGSGSAEQESITPVNSITRTFIHAQKRAGDVAGNGLNDYGHQVWLSSIGAVSFQLEPVQTGDETEHYSVAWVIENTQTGDGSMSVHQVAGSVDNDETIEPRTTSVSIGTTLGNTSNSSLFITNDTSGDGTAYPRPMLGAIVASTTHFELYESDAGQIQQYRVEIIEWPVAQLAFEQNYYRFYVDNDAVTPTDPWPVGVSDLGENTSITANDDPLGEGERVRIRMTLQVNNATLPELTESFKLQYGRRDGASCSAIGSNDWEDVGAPGSGEIWRGYDATPVDGVEVASTSLLIDSVADVAGTYEEQNPTAINPYSASFGDDVEFDWIVEHNGAVQRADYCFRMVKSDDSTLAAYNHYPTLRTTGYTPVLSNWRWYDDAENLTPTTPLAAENVAPTDISNENEIKLRVSVAEVESAAGTNVKFAIQYSETSDFSGQTFFVAATNTCVANSLWCYADGGGDDNDSISSSTISDADSCIGGSGTGCGIRNEASTTASTLAQPALAVQEHEFTVRQAGARANAVYYFRLYDVNADEPILASSSYPSLQIEGPQLTFTLEGLPAGTTTEGVTADVTTTPTSVPFGSVLFGNEYEAIYRLNVDTTATEGYQMFMFARDQLINTYGDPIPGVIGTNAIPLSWSAGCPGGAAACFGYHTGDDVLSGGSTRFAADDTYAAFSTTVPEEIMSASTPAEDSVDVVFKLQVTDQQPAGAYETEIVYLAVPVF